MYKHTWAEINLDNLKFNIDNIKKYAPTEKIMGVVKANAYGHFCSAVVPFLKKQGIDKFAVSNEFEAVDLRDTVNDGTVLILGHADVKAVNELSDKNVTVAVFDNAYSEKLSASLSDGRKVKCHIKLDTGMGRIGFDCREHWNIEEFENSVEKLFELDNIIVTGAFTHFSSADKDGDESGEFTSGQYERFHKACGIIKRLSIKYNRGENLYFHCSNSAATLLDTSFDTAYNRAGIIMYGLTPSTGITLPCELKPVMSLKTTVGQVKIIKKGETVSYGRTFKAPHDILMAVIAIGYADGYMRGLSGKAEILIKGRRFPLIGRICMDQAMVEITGSNDIFEGDEVTLFGDGLPVEELSKALGTINYELVCAVAHRVPRVIIENGKVSDVIRYKSF